MSSLVSAATSRKTVLVLGRSATGLTVLTLSQVDEAVVVLAIGWPLTPEQQSAVSAAQERARTARVVFDAHLLASPDAIRGLVGATDRILVDAKPRETRRIGRALARRL